MAENRIEYRFVLDAFTPDTIPQARLAEYLADLAALYGETEAVHFVRLESSSLAVVSSIEMESEPVVSDRVLAADSDDAPVDAKRAYQSLVRRINEDHGKAFVARGQARVLEFTTAIPLDEPTAYGPFWQSGHLTGKVILVGGKTDTVSVKIEDANGITHTCKAGRGLAKRLSPYLFEQPVRLIGRGKWWRAATGQWKMEQFNVDDFTALEDESLATTVSRLRAIDARWKDRPDPLAELEELRRGDS
jgi:hypothetical protein